MTDLTKDIPFALAAVASDAELPAEADVVIIGGGIAGVAAAYYLTKKRYRVAVVEKGRIGAEQSGRNWGWVRQQNRDERELPLAKWALKAWAELAADIDADVGFRRDGLVYVTDRAEELAGWERWVNMARGYDVHSRMLTKAETAALMPAGSERWIGGVQSPSDGYAEPTLASPALAHAARARGATIHQNCAARGVEMQGGTIGAVVTERGRIRTSRVLCAGGAWTSLFCRWHGIDFPQSGVQASVLSTVPGPAVISGGLSTPGFTFRRRMDGGYTVSIRNRGRIEITPQGLRYARRFLPIFRERWSSSISLGVGRSFFSGPEALARWDFDSISPFEKIRVLNPAADDATISAALDALAQNYPALKGIGVAQKWGAWIDSTPDAVAAIGEAPGVPGFFVSSGFSGHGFGVGPAAGRLAADLIVGDKPIVDPHPLRFARFSEGDLGAPAAM